MRYFKRSEFACKCGCGFDTVDYQLGEVLDDLRAHFDRPITVNSGCRCQDHNDKIGGSKGSKHILGIAADIVVKDIDPSIVTNYLLGEHLGKYGIGRYTNFTHIDVRSTRARW